jgi:hypothetical protein
MADLPPYNTALGDFLTKIDSKTTAQFKGVTTQVYPLRADIEKLREFCSDNLNRSKESGPPPIKIEPVAPWVLMQVCNYNFMGPAGGKGYVSQHEVAFGIPVTWQQTEGQKTSRELAVFYPFIFVDNSLSLTLGRQVYGWAKAGIEVDRRLPNFDPRDPIVLSICRKRYLRPGHRKYQALQTVYDDAGITENLLRVIQKPSFASTWPAIDLLLQWPKMMGSILNTAAGTLDTAGRTLSGFASADMPSLGRDLQSLGDIIIRLYAYMNNFAPTLFRLMGAGAGASNGATSSRVAILTEKQIRDTIRTDMACYLATIRSQICIDSVRSGGILFNPALADLSGGIEINLFETDEEPIVEQLGILSSGVTTIDDKDGKLGKTAHVIQPMMPFWAQADVSYKAAADYQLARTKWTWWSTSDGLAIPHTPGSPPAIHYKNYGSGTGGEVQGPIKSEDFVLRMYPLHVKDPDKLQKLVDDYLESSTLPVRFKITEPPQVLMLVSRFKKTSDSNGEFLSEDRVLTFAVPVTYMGQDEDRRTLVHLYSFAGTDWTVITDNEVYGRFTIKSTVDSPASTWIDYTPEGGQGLLTVKTWVLVEPDPTKLDAKQEAQLMPIIEIEEDSYSLDDESPTFWEFSTGIARIDPSDFVDRRTIDGGIRERVVTPSSVRALFSYSTVPHTHQVLKLYRRLLGFHPEVVPGTFFLVALKQVRDAQAVEGAALQTIVGVQREVEIEDKIADPVSVTIYDYPGLEMGRKLGLADVLQIPESRPGNKRTFLSKRGAVYRGTMTEHQAETLFYRFGDGAWQTGEPDLTTL